MSRDPYRPLTACLGTQLRTLACSGAVGEGAGHGGRSLRRSQVCEDPEKGAPGKGTEGSEGTAGAGGQRQPAFQGTLSSSCPQVSPLERLAGLAWGEGAALPVSSPPPCSPRVLKMEEFFPETYRLDIRDEREAFFTLFDGERPLDARPLWERGAGMDHGPGTLRAGPGLTRPRGAWPWRGEGVEPGGRRVEGLGWALWRRSLVRGGTMAGRAGAVWAWPLLGVAGPDWAWSERPGLARSSGLFLQEITSGSASPLPATRAKASSCSGTRRKSLPCKSRPRASRTTPSTARCRSERLRRGSCRGVGHSSRWGWGWPWAPLAPGRAGGAPRAHRGVLGHGKLWCPPLGPVVAGRGGAVTDCPGCRGDALHPNPTHRGSCTWGRDREALVGSFPSLGTAPLSSPAGRPASLPSPAQPAPAFRPGAELTTPPWLPLPLDEIQTLSLTAGGGGAAVWPPKGPFGAPHTSVGLCHSCRLRPPSALGVFRPTCSFLLGRLLPAFQP